ncbi:hypothetical protein [Georgenia sp. SUBG003]|uniref:hypothetical protein n=1 Tax=Georgenia sp. SUBG003 TaxID=1497974 RepID=UPI0004D68128|nr:hypothetical protein DA06_13450 [Georgenia sp. SUBG003]
MKTARVISATAAVAAGVALLSPGGSSYASWSDEATVPGTSLSSGRLELSAARLSVTVDRDGTESPLADVPELHVGDIVVVRTSTALVLEGDALVAALALDDAFLLADGTPARDVTVSVSADPAGSGLVGSPLTGWQVGPGHSGTTVHATITLPISGENRTVGDGLTTWSLVQTGAAAPAGGWSSAVSLPVDLPAVADDADSWRPQVTLAPDDLGVIGNVKTFKFSWSWDEAATDATVWQLLQLRNGVWEVLKSVPGSATSFTVTSDEVKAFATNDATTDFLVRVYPTGLQGDFFDATNAYRMRYSSGAGHMEFVELVPVEGGAAR